MFFDDPTVVVNKHNGDYDVLIQRGTKWGNPFKVTEERKRDEALNKFEGYFLSQIRNGIITQEDLKSLHGKRLGCSCKPKRCHGDFIAYCVELMFSDVHDHETKEKFFNMEIKQNNEY